AGHVQQADQFFGRMMDTEQPVEPAVEPAAEPAVETTASTVPPPPVQGGRPMRWYVLRVASNREEQVCEALIRKVKIEGLEDRVGRILVPMQREKRMKAGQVKLYDRKLYPGYVFIEMETEEDGRVPEDVWFLIKDTSGVGDFIGSDGKPSEMKVHDVEKMLSVVEKSAEAPTLAGLAGGEKGGPAR